MEDQLYILLKKLVLKNNIQLNQEELKLQLKSHPSYPSLHSLTGVLTHFDIPNIAIRLQTNDKILTQLPSCFIAIIKQNGGEQFELVEKKNNRIKLTSLDNKNEIVSNEEFLSRWNGVILAIEKDENTVETKTTVLPTVLKWFLFSIGIAILGYSCYLIPDVFAQFHFILSIIGVIISVIIVKHEFGLQSKSANSICNMTEHTSCDAVLNSNGAKFFSLFNLSDVCIVVFSAFTLYWITSISLETNSYLNFSFFAIASLPMVAYSLYYQFQVVKKWCPLCLGIISVLVMQFSVLTLNKSVVLTNSFDLLSITQFILVALIAIGIWSTLKPIIKKITNLSKIEVDHFKFKRNYSLFKAVLKEGNSIFNTEPIEGELIFGNENASVEIILVTSPLCFFCKKAHRDIDKILASLKDKVKITVRFNVSLLEEDNVLYQITSQLLHIYHTKGKDQCLKALNEVYHENANLQQWIEEQEIQLKASSKNTLFQQNNWCKINKIDFTPALYINKKEFPKEYDRQDLILFIDDLLEESSTNNIPSEKELIAS